MKKISALLILTNALAWAAPFQPSEQTPELLAKAQQAYLDGQFSVSVNTLKQAYMASVNDSVAQKNILQMYNKIDSISPKPQIDVGWSLPSEVLALRVSVSRRFEKNIITHQMIFNGEVASLEEMTSFQVVRYPDTIVLDKVKKIGRFKDSQPENKIEIDYRSPANAFDVSAGLYLINFTTKSGSNIHGWFFLDENANSSTQPQLTHMDGNPVFNTGNPQVEWPNFVSPEYKKDSETRGFSLWVGKADVDEGVWNYFSSDMNQRSAILGSPVVDTHGWSRGPLENGDYYVLLLFSEYHNFGPLRISRRSSVVKYFTIKK
jgi:hypothetical protein